MASWPKPIPVRDWMGSPVAVIQADATVREAIELMRGRKIRHLPVVDPDARLVGIVTDRDLRQMLFDPAIQDRIEQVAAALDDRLVRDVMTWAVVTVGPETELRLAARLMLEQKIGALPVVERRRVVGILTERDVLRALTTLLRADVMTARPLAAAQFAGEPYDYGFPEPIWRALTENTGGPSA